jgi:hypothetical protein
VCVSPRPFLSVFSVYLSCTLVWFILVLRLAEEDTRLSLSYILRCSDGKGPSLAVPCFLAAKMDSD